MKPRRKALPEAPVPWTAPGVRTVEARREAPVPWTAPGGRVEVPPGAPSPGPPGGGALKAPAGGTVPWILRIAVQAADGMFARRFPAVEALLSPTFTGRRECGHLGKRELRVSWAASRTLLERITSKKRLRAKLREVKTELMRRRHLPIPEQGQWLASVVRGHCAYYAVPGNIDAVAAFHKQAVRLWLRALRRRRQRTSLTWERMNRLDLRWLPTDRILHPWPNVRFDARTQGRRPVR